MMVLEEELQSVAESQLLLAKEVLTFIREHPLRDDIGNVNSDAVIKVLMLAQVAAIGVPNSLAMLGVDA